MSTKIEEFDQQKVFDRMAPGWYNRRHWTIFRHELEELARKWQTGRMLNIGCGHGADFLPFKQGFELYGLDFSIEMLHFAKKYAAKFNFDIRLLHGDAANLPIESASMDWAISVAAYHHLKDAGNRQQAFYELNRILKPGGEAFVTVWNHWQPVFWFKPKEIHVKWRTQETDLYRYYYLFSRHELERLARKAGFKILRSHTEASYRFPIKQFSRNICLLLGKIV